MYKNPANRDMTEVTKKLEVPISSRMAGFTFVEIILSLVLLSILTAVFGMGLVAAVESYAFSRSNADQAQKGQLAMQRISRELSELVGINAVDSGPDYLVYSRVQDNDTAPPSKVFMGICHDNINSLLYLLSNIGDISNLSVDDCRSGKILLDGVQAFSLSYFSGDNAWVLDGNDPLNLNQLSTIQITLGVNRNDSGNRQYTFSELIHMRNTENIGGAHLFN